MRRFYDSFVTVLSYESFIDLLDLNIKVINEASFNNQLYFKVLNPAVYGLTSNYRVPVLLMVLAMMYLFKTAIITASYLID